MATLATLAIATESRYSFFCIPSIDQRTASDCAIPSVYCEPTSLEQVKFNHLMDVNYDIKTQDNEPIRGSRILKVSRSTEPSFIA
jgi:hypothetical protein